ncbi:Presenilin, signal peptide peptidase, family [Teratosphaeria destructans]|uniref:Presenilin, signal peptide peptidase, family n=1 Tax=Teratosphaeria destructans TaxID=418781 RepID=A0A9W7VXJ6_9PEZI|nr:Presenilin, signal peptide peptidase, family [Teratosphaeria destructans]
MEGLSPQDAIVFPVTAGVVLAALYFLIKRYGADVVNVVLGVYFSVVGTFSVGNMVSDAGHLLAGLRLPRLLRQGREAGGRLDGASHARAQDASRETSPALLGISLPDAWLKGLWHVRALVKQKFSTTLYIHDVVDFRATLTRISAVSAVVGVGSVAYATFIDKPWWLTNLQGFGVCYGALQLLSPTSFPTGSLILLGLFCYDVWAVFFTPLMVTVAKNLDVPIKLVFPRPDEGYSMLGLGDIVLPGIMIGLALRFDLYMFYLRKQKKPPTTAATDGEQSDAVEKAPYVPVTGTLGDRFWTRRLPPTAKPAKLTTTFPKPYFTASLIGYVTGMLATLAVMSVSQHAQPALLYLVPGVLLSLWGTGLLRGELQPMWAFSEALPGDDQDADPAADDDRSWLQYLKDEILGPGANPHAEDGDPKASEDATPGPDLLVSFSLARVPPRSRTQTSTSEATQTVPQAPTTTDPEPPGTKPDDPVLVVGPED